MGWLHGWFDWGEGPVQLIDASSWLIGLPGGGETDSLEMAIVLHIRCYLPCVRPELLSLVADSGCSVGGDLGGDLGGAVQESCREASLVGLGVLAGLLTASSFVSLASTSFFFLFFCGGGRDEQPWWTAGPT